MINSMIINAMERGYLPDSLIRFGIRQLCSERLDSLNEPTLDLSREEFMKYVSMLKSSPVAIETGKANEQHYELPPEFFTLVLGKFRKYSCGLWPEGCHTLDESEAKAIDETLERAEIQDGMKILELGCGWGSLSLTMAERYPNSQILAISNSAPQKKYIDEQARLRQLTNLEVRTRDVSRLEDLDGDTGTFDRVVSVEMFEHFRNYETLLARIDRWLKPTGKLFVHIFTHQRYAYLFETEGDDNWMGRYFFTGGQMPAHTLLLHFQRDLLIEKEWSWNGTHYQKTSEAWLKNMDNKRDEILNIFKNVYGSNEAGVWFHRWRIFFISCAELFGFKEGTEWGVSHYLFTKRGGSGI